MEIDSPLTVLSTNIRRYELYVYCELTHNIIDVSVVIPATEEAGQAQDEDRGTEECQAEIMERHGPVLHHVSDQ